MTLEIRNILITALVLGLSTAGSAWAQDAVVHISQADAIRAATSKIEPQYPAMAKQLHLEGAVQLEARISEEGVVEEVKPLTGNAVLMNAAMAAMKQWKFIPFTTGGKPAKAVADLTFRFKL